MFANKMFGGRISRGMHSMKLWAYPSLIISSDLHRSLGKLSQNDSDAVFLSIIDQQSAAAGHNLMNKVNKLKGFDKVSSLSTSLNLKSCFYLILEMESELAQFRRRKELERSKEEIKDKVQGVWDSFCTRLTTALLPTSDPNSTTTEEDNDSTGVSEEDDISPRILWLQRGLLTLTWLLLFVAFVKIEFGAVYFTISLLVIIYWNTATSKRKRGEVSAYSVFNKGCESIDGTLKPEHLEKSLLYRGS